MAAEGGGMMALAHSGLARGKVEPTGFVSGGAGSGAGRARGAAGRPGGGGESGAGGLREVPGSPRRSGGWEARPGGGRPASPSVRRRPPSGRGPASIRAAQPARGGRQCGHRVAGAGRAVRTGSCAARRGSAGKASPGAGGTWVE